MKMCSHIAFKLASSAFIGLGGCWPLGVHAQTEAGAAAADGIDDIIVTARRRDERLQDVPVAVTAIQSDTLRTQNITSTSDLTRITPGLVVTPTNRTSTPGYAIRGQRNSVVNLTADASVAVYVDELGSSRPTGTSQSFFDIANVQVLKGPQGTLFGRNTTGGAILISPQRPTDAFEGYLQGSVGNFSFIDLEGVLNAPVNANLALRVGGKVTRRDGYMHNFLTGQDTNDADTESYRAQLLWSPSGEVQSNTMAQFFRAEQGGDGPKLIAYDPNGVPAVGPANQAILRAQLAQEFALTQTLGKYQYRSTQPGVDNAKVYAIQNNTSINLGDVGAFGKITLKNIAGYRRTSNEYSSDYDGSAVQYIEFPGKQFAKSWSEEFQIQGDAGRLRYTLGAYYFEERGRDFLKLQQFAVLATTAPASFPSYSVQDYDVRNTSRAAFAHFEIDLSSQLTAAAGGRITRDLRSINYHNMTYGGVTPTVFRCSLTATNQANDSRDTCNTKAAKVFTEPTWDIALNYKFSPNLMVYVANHRGYRSGQFNGGPIAGLPIVAVKPEIVTEFEAGLKKDGRIGAVPLRLDLAVYRQKYDQVQRTVSRADNSVSPARVIAQVVNAAQATITGAEIASTIKITPVFEINIAYSYVRAKYDDWVDTYLVAGVPTNVDIADSKFLQVPAHQGSVTAKYALPIPEDSGALSISGTYYYQSRMALNDVNTSNCGPNGLYPGCRNRTAFEPGYGLINARLDWRNIAGKGVDAAIFVNNLTDKFYHTGAAYILNSVGVASVSTGAPRMFGMEVRVPFGAKAY